MVSTMSSLDCLLPLMQHRGVKLSAAEFQHIVNTTFHAFESEVYDEIHKGMWDSLDQQFQLLAADALRDAQDIPETLVAVDVGCGTGLSAELLRRTQLGRRISRLCLVDTAPEMLARAAQRASSWGIELELVEGTLDDVTAKRFDLVLVCSVLHHLPNLTSFFASVQRLQPRGGLFIHLQDPNGDYRQDPEFAARQQQLRAAALRPSTGLRRFTPARIARHLKARFAAPGTDRYIKKVNEALLARGVIDSPMTADEMWHVTDLHVYDGGLSISQMTRDLNSYELLSKRSYGFFGELWSDLPSAFRAYEEELIRQRALNGRELAGVWQKRA